MQTEQTMPANLIPTDRSTANTAFHTAIHQEKQVVTYIWLCRVAADRVWM